MLAPLDKLAGLLSRLPGIGSRSAERIALRLATGPRQLVRDLVAALNDLDQKVASCSICCALTTADRNPCRICTDAGRDDELLCVVEDPADVDVIEKSAGMRGRYHILNGRISAMAGKGPWDLRLNGLVERVEKGKVKEIVLAIGTDMEGDATAGFIAELFKGRNVNVTRLGFGLPVGSGVGFSDPVTIGRALRGRQKV